jgi:hypothetical protein
MRPLHQRTQATLNEEFELIFKWDTIEEIGPYELKYRDRRVPGKVLEIELISGAKKYVYGVRTTAKTISAMV